MPDRPIKLTVAPIEPGFADIRAGGVLVGFATADYYWHWTARLLKKASHLAGGWAGTIQRPGQQELRAALRDQLAEKGPWWVTAARETAATPGHSSWPGVA